MGACEAERGTILSHKELGLINIPLPSIEVQCSVVADIERQNCQQTQVRDNIRSQIDILTAYRKSLIHECVTGQRRIYEADMQRAIHVLAGWPVQFLPATSPLVEEALAEAVTVDVEGTPARVFTAEHLAAIALQTGRAKDHARLLQFIEAAAINAERFQAMVRRHGLLDRWQTFERRFLQGPS